jgi:hypothetical protein
VDSEIQGDGVKPQRPRESKVKGGGDYGSTVAAWVIRLRHRSICSGKLLRGGITFGSGGKLVEQGVLLGRGGGLSRRSVLFGWCGKPLGQSVALVSAWRGCYGVGKGGSKHE